MDKLIFSLMLLVLANSAWAAGTSCKKASTFVAQAICNNPELAELDKNLNKLFLTALSTGDKKNVKRQQKAWLKEVRNICTDNLCLREVYNARIRELSANGSDQSYLKDIAGEYTRVNANGNPDDSASIRIVKVKEGLVEVIGHAIYVMNSETGTGNVGELEGEHTLVGNKIHYSNGTDNDSCKLDITFEPKTLSITGDNGNCGGLNVDFDGHYVKK